MAFEQRDSLRKQLDTIHIESLTSLDQFSLLARRGKIVNASTSGFLLHIHRQDLVPKILRENLTIDYVVGERVKLLISEMNLEIEGTVTRTKLVGQGVFAVAVDFTKNAPEYWRECLLDLLPNSGEIDQFEGCEIES